MRSKIPESLVLVHGVHVIYSSSPVTQSTGRSAGSAWLHTQSGRPRLCQWRTVNDWHESLPDIWRYQLAFRPNNQYVNLGQFNLKQIYDIN